MNGLIERLGWVLVHSLWQFALVALLAGIVSRTMRRSSAAARYGTFAFAMGVLVVAPVATWWWLPVDVRHELASREVRSFGPASEFVTTPGAEASQIASDFDSKSEHDSLLDDIRRTEGVSPLVVAESNDIPSTTGLTPPVRLTHSSWSERVAEILRPWLSWIVVGWSLGVMASSLRPLLGWHTLRRLKRFGVSPISDDVRSALHRVSERLRLRRAVNVLQSTLAQVPVVVGYLRPVILLPVSLLTSLPAEQLEAILAHELAHVRRHDFLVNLLQTLVETLFFYHPAVWWLSRQIRIEREHCCDDLVVKLLGNRIEYGRALVTIEELRGQSTVLALGATDGSLLSRVRRIIGVTPDRAAVRLSDRWPVAFLGIVTLGVVLTVSLGTFVASRADLETPASERDSNLRAGRGTPDAALDSIAGLPNSDEETNPPNNANGDLRSNPAAGSGDPRRAQSAKVTTEASNDVRVEFIGLAMMEKEAKMWWKPDGTLLDEVPKHGQVTVSVSGQEVRRALIRVHGDKVSYSDVIAPGMSNVLLAEAPGSGGPFIRIEGGYAFPPGQKTGRFEVGVARQPQSPVRYLNATGQRVTFIRRAKSDRQMLVVDRIAPDRGGPRGALLVDDARGSKPSTVEIGELKTIADHIAEDLEVLSVDVPPLRQPALINGQSVMTAEKEADNKLLSQQTRLTWRAPLVPKPMNVELVLIDVRGNQHRSVLSGFKISEEDWSGRLPHWGRTERYSQFNVPLEKVAGFEYHVRPYQHWVTFENVSLQPGVQTDVKIKVESSPNEKPRAGRGSPDPALDATAGLPNSDEDTNPMNNANGDLRSNPAVGSGDTRRAQSKLPAGRAWQRVEPYAAPSFDQFFPDDPEAGRALSKLWKAVDKETRDDREILATVRKGLRRTTEHRTLILSWIGNRYIWGKSPQNADAIEIMYHAADFSGETADPYGTRHYAVYFGLSVVEPKSPAILRTLAELCMRVDDPNDLDRVAWGSRKQQQELVEHLKAFFAADNESVRAKAEVCQQIFKGELKAFAWATEQAKVRAEKKFTGQLPAIKAVLESGSSDERRKTLDLITAERIALIMDDSFVAAFAKCAEDNDASVRNSVAIVGGARWIWESQHQHPDAIKLMVQLSTDADREVRYNAVYYGLSPIQMKSDEVVRRLLEMAFADQVSDLRLRIEWGLNGNEKQVIKLLDEYIRGPNEQQSKAAREFLRQWSARAGRGSPDLALDPTAGLPNSDEDPNPTNNANGDLRSNPAAASGDPRSAQYVAELPNGARMELVGITRNLAKSRTGWKPNGEPLADGPEWPRSAQLRGRSQNSLDNFLLEGDGTPDEDAFDLLLQFENVKSQPSLKLRFPSSFYLYITEHLEKPHLLRVPCRLDKIREPSEVRIGLTDEPWGIPQQVSPTGELLNKLDESSPYWSSYQKVKFDVRPSRDRSDQLQFFLQWPVEEVAVETRIVDAKGKGEWVSGSRKGGSKLHFVNSFGEPAPRFDGNAGFILGLPREGLACVEYRLRPYQHWVTFENVSLRPGQKTDVKVKVASSASDIEPTSPPDGLEFLKPYPKLHGLSLDMTEPQFLEIVKQQELKTRKTIDGKKATHPLALGDGHTLIVMFDKDEKCSGIQRVRGEDNSGAGQQAAQPKQQPDKSDQERMVGEWVIMNADSKAQGQRWVIHKDHLLMNYYGPGALARHYHFLDASKNPKQIDIGFTPENSPHAIKGIYVLDGDELRLCLGEKGKDRPAAFPKKPGPSEVLILHRSPPAAEAKTADNANEDPRSGERRGQETRAEREPNPLPGQSSDPAKELAAFQGTWCWDLSQPWTWPQPIGVGTDSNGRKSEKRWIVKGNQITWISQEGRRINVNFTIDPTKTPKQIDFTFLNGPHRGAKSIGIYQPQQGNPNYLWLCMTDPGSDAPRPTDISAGTFKKQSMIGIYPVAPPEKPSKAKAIERLQGVWQMELCDSFTETFGGTQKEVSKWQWTIKGDEILWSRDDRLWKMKFEVDPTKSPNEIDLTYLVGPFKGKKCQGMYVFGGVDGQTLMISIQDPGSQAPRPKDISIQGGVATSLIFLRPSDPSDIERELGSFQGTWTLKNFDTGDEKKDPSSWPLPIGRGPDKSGDGSELRWAVKGNEITWTSRTGEEIKASFTIDPWKSPKQIDLTFLTGRYKGETCPGIYQRGDLDPGIYQRGDLLDENILWLCMADPKSKTARPKNFSYAWREGRSLMSLYPFEPHDTSVQRPANPKPSSEPVSPPTKDSPNVVSDPAPQTTSRANDNGVQARPPLLEFRFAAQPADSKFEPRVPADFEKREYPSNSVIGRMVAKDKGFVWVGMAESKEVISALPVERPHAANAREALLADTPEHALPFNGKWSIEDCRVVPEESVGQVKRFAIELKLNEAGGAAMRTLTKSHLNQPLAILINNKVIAAPIVRSEIGRDIAITGNFTREQADKLAAALRPRAATEEPKPPGEEFNTTKER